MQSDHRNFLLQLVPQNSICAEIGVHKGDLSDQILRIVNPKELHLIDPWKYEHSSVYQNAWYGGEAKGRQIEMDARYEAVLHRFEPDIRAKRVKIHRGTSVDVLQKFPDGYFDWVYIDGNHLYEFVKQDLELSFRKTKAGGYITGDDYETIGWWEDGVTRAVNQFTAEKSVQVVSTLNNQFVLRK